MPKQAPGGNDKAGAAESAAPNVALQCKSQTPCDGAAADGNRGAGARETSILGAFLRFAGATAGYLVGGPAGAALGSAVGEIAGDIAAQRSGMMWPALGRALLASRQAYDEQDAGGRSAHDGRHL